MKWLATLRAPQLWLCLILCLRVGMAAGFAYILPLGAAADEAAHFSNVQYLATYGALPTEFWRIPPDQRQFIAGSYEAYQPPLYYALAAGWVHGIRFVTGAVPAFVQLSVVEHDALAYGFVPPEYGKTDILDEPALAQEWRSVRWLSILLGLLPIGAAYALGRRLWPHSTCLPLVPAALLAFTPQMIYFSAAVNNEILATGLGGTALVALARALDANARKRAWLFTGLLTGLALLTKLSVVLLVPAVIIAVMLWPRPWRERSYALAVALIAMTLVSGWYFAYRTLTTGDPTGTRSVRELFTLYGPGVEIPLTLEGVKTDAIWTFDSAWAMPPMFVSKWIYLFLAALTVASIWGMAVMGTRMVKHTAPPVFFVLLSLLVLQGLLFAGTYLFSGLQVNQGHVLYLAWYPLAVGLTFALGEGVQRLDRRLPEWVRVASVCTALFVVSWATLALYVIPFYLTP